MWVGWIEQYGYLAVFFGMVVEGEIALVLAGYTLSRGYLEPLPVFLLAIAGGTAGDTMYYLLGRHFGGRLIRRFPRLRRLRARAVLLVRRWGRSAAFLTRFAYGLRTVLPMTIGAARMPPRIFLPFNLAGSLTFALVYLTLGYLFGEAIEELLGRVKPYEKWILIGILAMGAIVWAVREWRIFRTPEEEVGSVKGEE